MVDLGRQAARGTAVTLVAQLGRFVLQIGSLVVLARLLSPEAFGLVAMVTSLIGIAELVRDFGLSSAAVQAKHLSHEERTNLFWINVAIGTGCAIIAVVGGTADRGSVSRGTRVIDRPGTRRGCSWSAASRPSTGPT